MITPYISELHIRVNNWLKNALPEQRVIEEHILKSDNPYVQKALAKYISDAFNLRENHKENKKIPKNNRGNEVTARRECVADYTFDNKMYCFHITFLTYLHIYQFLGLPRFSAITSHLLSKYFFSSTP